MPLGTWIDPDNFNASNLLRGPALPPQCGDESQWRHTCCGDGRLSRGKLRPRGCRLSRFGDFPSASAVSQRDVPHDVRQFRPKSNGCLR